MWTTLKNGKKHVHTSQRKKLPLANSAQQQTFPSSFPGCLPSGIFPCPVGGEAIPQHQRFVSSSTEDRAAIWGHCETQYTWGVAFEVSHADHGWVLPDGKLVLRKAVGRYQLLVVLGPEYGTYLVMDGKRLLWSCISWQTTWSHGRGIKILRNKWIPEYSMCWHLVKVLEHSVPQNKCNFSLNFTIGWSFGDPVAHSGSSLLAWEKLWQWAINFQSMIIRFFEPVWPHFLPMIDGSMSNIFEQ